MSKNISTAELSHEEWLKLRKTGIGGSDAGAICGLNPYASPMSVYQDKTTMEVEEINNEAMRQGRDLEDYVARRFMEATGLKVRRSNMMYRSEEHPFMLADVDRLIVGKDAGLECKTASAYNLDKWKEDEIPAHYLIQCHHYMSVTGKQTWYIAVVILGCGFKYAEIPRDEDLIKNLVSIEKQFWNSHVVKRIIPDPDGSEACDEVLEQYFHTARKNSAILLTGFDDKIRRRLEIVKLMDKLGEEKNQIDQQIKLFMKDHEMAYNEKYRVTWSNVDTLHLDSKRIKAEKPEIYTEFSYRTSSRRFTIKAA
ncbi:YqaJ viral recombinase family protein [Lacrimispora amygdalina]|uniref:YqaJ viral recombinase family nuclease n=1 Tax=Lacrimispora amygdalina TaxID=253257 RepID=UPI000BE3B88C|nr:YqaJ viral recombinase family protein [Lacrimispora amygdalina]